PQLSGSFWKFLQPPAQHVSPPAHTPPLPHAPPPLSTPPPPSPLPESVPPASTPPHDPAHVPHDPPPADGHHPPPAPHDPAPAAARNRSRRPTGTCRNSDPYWAGSTFRRPCSSSNRPRNNRRGTWVVRRTSTRRFRTCLRPRSDNTSPWGRTNRALRSSTHR